MAGSRPEQHVRFAWWGAEELGAAWARSTTSTSCRRQNWRSIRAYLNFDMVASPNAAYFALRRRQLRRRRAPARGPAGSAQIEKLFEDYYDIRGLRHERHRLRRPLRLRAVHRARHPGRWHLHRRRGRSRPPRRRPSAAARRAGVRRLLPPGVRHHGQHQRHGAGRNADAMAYATLTLAQQGHRGGNCTAAAVSWRRHGAASVPGPAPRRRRPGTRSGRRATRRNARAPPGVDLTEWSAAPWTPRTDQSPQGDDDAQQ